MNIRVELVAVLTPSQELTHGISLPLQWAVLRGRKMVVYSRYSDESVRLLRSVIGMTILH